MIPVSVNNFSSRLRALRTENGFTQKDIADKVPCTQQFIFGLEVGTKRATADTLSRLADIFGVSTDYLLGRTDIR